MNRKRGRDASAEDKESSSELEPSTLEEGKSANAPEATGPASPGETKDI